MDKCCENCKFAIFDSVPYGMGSTSYFSGCKKEDDFTEENEFDGSADWECPFWTACTDDI